MERRDRPADWDDRGRPGAGRDRQRPGARSAEAGLGIDARRAPPFENWGDKEWLQLGVEIAATGRCSQFMHGEQGALLCTAKIVETVPWIDAKYYAVHPGDGRGPPRRGVRQVPRRQADAATTRSTPTSRCCSTTSSTTAAGT
ncbi:MAG: hypothetical protein U5R31_12330 [Acidimicrobiia bacterium]|nr:hypothetical protein [Acidimicrobiia bacterium]